MNLQPLVSISITTYNHEKYIETSLLSVLNQEVNFPIEIVLSNDNSKDNTHQVIQNIIATHPKGNLIKYYNQTPNLGYVPNLLFTFQKSNGKYIAILDGDDEWIDTQKLQKQVDFLENNEDFSAIASDSKVIYEDIDTPPHTFTIFGGKELEINDLLNLQLFQTSTFLFKKDILSDNDFPTNILSADRCIFLLAGCYGKVKVLPEQTSTYRKFNASLSKQVTLETMQKDWAICPFITSKTHKINKFKLKSYLYYTAFAYSNTISKKEFKKNAFKHLIHKILSKKTIHPLVVRRTYLDTKKVIHKKYTEKQF